jgi:Rrf2 family protein
MALYSAGVEYALHTLVNLRLATPNAPSARELAEFQRLPVAYTRRLMTQLEKAGLAIAAEGPNGGWELARTAADITVLDVVDAVDANASVFACRDVREQCALWGTDAPPSSVTTGTCAIHATMNDAETALRLSLSQTSIADLANKLTAKTSAKALQAVPIWFSEQRKNRR